MSDSETRPILPPELQELIVDALAPVDDDQHPPQTTSNSALQTCLFVSRTFRYRARPYIFSSASISNTVKGKAIERLSLLRQILTATDNATPSIASFIRHFSFDNTFGHENSLGILDSSDFVSVLRLLHASKYGISSLSLLLDDLHIVAWNDTSAEFCQAVRGLCRSPFLKELTIAHLFNIPRTLFNGTYVENLTLKGISLSTSESLHAYNTNSDATPSPQNHTQIPNQKQNAILESPPPLDSFTTDHTFLFPRFWTQNTNIHNLRTPLSPFRALRHLRVAGLNSTCFTGAWNATSELMGVARKSLETIEFEMDGNYRFASNPASLNSLTTLAHLSSLTHLSFALTSPTVTGSSITQVGLWPIIAILEDSITHFNTTDSISQNSTLDDGVINAPEQPTSPCPPSLTNLAINLRLTSFLPLPGRKVFVPAQEEWRVFDEVLSRFIGVQESRVGLSIVLFIQVDVILPTNPSSGTASSSRIPHRRISSLSTYREADDAPDCELSAKADSALSLATIPLPLASSTFPPAEATTSTPTRTSTTTSSKSTPPSPTAAAGPTPTQTAKKHTSRIKKSLLPLLPKMMEDERFGVYVDVKVYSKRQGTEFTL